MHLIIKIQQKIQIQQIQLVNNFSNYFQFTLFCFAMSSPAPPKDTKSTIQPAPQTQPVNTAASAKKPEADPKAAAASTSASKPQTAATTTTTTKVDPKTQQTQNDVKKSADGPSNPSKPPTAPAAPKDTKNQTAQQTSKQSTSGQAAAANTSTAKTPATTNSTANKQPVNDPKKAATTSSQSSATAPAKPVTSTAKDTKSNTAPAPAPPAQKTDSKSAAATSNTSKSATSTAANNSTNKANAPAPAPAPKPAPKPAYTAEQQKQIDELKKKLIETKQAHADEKLRLEAWNDFVHKDQANKEQMRKQSQMLDNQMAKNKAMADEVLDLKINLRREEMIKVLLNQRKSKQSEANIQAQLKNFETQVTKELAAVQKSKDLVIKEIKQAEDDVKINIPTKVKRFNDQTKEIEGKKVVLTENISSAKKEVASLEAEKVTMVKQRQAISKLISTATKTPIKPDEVSQFEQPLRQIALRQEATYQTLPADAKDKMDATVRKVSWVEKPKKDEPVKPKQPDAKPVEKPAEVKKAADTKAASPAAGSTKPNALMEALTKSLQKKVTSQLKIEKDRQEFQEKEKQRVAQLNQDKVDSMKKIDEYQKDVASFPERQKKLLADLEQTKKQRSELAKTMEDLLKDEIYGLSLPQ